MANTLTKLDTVTVGSGGAASVTFSNIPQTYTDLVVKFSARNTSTGQYAFYRFNNDSTSAYSARVLTGDGSSATSLTNTYTGNIANIGTSADTANTFGNGEIYIPNYIGNTNKSSSTDAVNENNATTAYANLTANLWNNSAAISRIDLLPTAGNFAQYSTFTLYGVFKEDVSVAPAVPTIGTASDGGTGTTASVAFTPVSGAASYTATSTPGSFTGTAATTPVTVGGLTTGTAYTFKVKANNPIGSSGESAASNSVTPEAPGVFESIASVSGTGSSATISFTSIPSTYKHLQIRYNARCASGAITDHYIRLNSDTGSNYARHWVFSLDSGGPYTSAASTTTPPSMGYIQGYDTNPTTGGIVDIIDYQSTSKNKTIRYITGGAEQQTSSQGALTIGSALWLNNTNAINQIDLVLASSNWSTSSTFSLYGIKG
jgi:hypothetical protein